MKSRPQLIWRGAVLTSLALLVGCSTPLERCIDGVNRDIRVLDRLIAESERDLARGYGTKEVIVSDSRYEMCRPPIPPTDKHPGYPAYYCWRDYDRSETRPVAIDLAEERQKLAGMKAKRSQLAAQAEPAIKACYVQYPEKAK